MDATLQAILRELFRVSLNEDRLTARVKELEAEINQAAIQLVAAQSASKPTLLRKEKP